jgi:hypothetical protein
VEEMRRACNILFGNPEGKRPLARSGRGLEDNIKMDLQEIGCGGDWFQLLLDSQVMGLACLYEKVDEILGSMKRRGFIEQRAAV